MPSHVKWPDSPPPTEGEKEWVFPHPRRDVPLISPAAFPHPNPFIKLATPLFLLADGIVNERSRPADPSVFRQAVLQHINSLSEVVKQEKITMRVFTDARYLLCSFLDEMILTTEWSKTVQWGTKSLLSTFHHDTQGGEKFFTVVEKWMHEPKKNRDLLEFAFVCLKLGFQGKYKWVARGQERLAILEEELYRLIQPAGPSPSLLLHQKKSEKRVRKFRQVKVLLLTFSLVGLVTLAGLWNYCFFEIRNSTDVVLSELVDTARPAEPVPLAPSEAPHA